MSAQRLRGGLLLAVCLLPVFLSANFVWRFGVDVPFWDEWELVPLLRSLHDGHLSPGDLTDEPCRAQLAPQVERVVVHPRETAAVRRLRSPHRS